MVYLFLFFVFMLNLCFPSKSNMVIEIAEFEQGCDGFPGPINC